MTKVAEEVRVVDTDPAILIRREDSQLGSDGGMGRGH
jgi:hypothetical protein